MKKDVTDHKDELTGRRVVRGREKECEEYYVNARHHLS